MDLKRLRVELRRFVFQARNGFPAQIEQEETEAWKRRFMRLMSMELGPASQLEIFNATSALARTTEEHLWLYETMSGRSNRRPTGLSPMEALVLYAEKAPG